MHADTAVRDKPAPGTDGRFFGIGTSHVDGVSASHILTHLATANHLYYHKKDEATGEKTVFGIGLSDLRATTAAQLRAWEKDMTAQGYTDVKILHNPKGVTVAMYRHPENNTLYMTFTGTDSAGDYVSHAENGVEHIASKLGLARALVESPIGGKVQNEVVRNVNGELAWWERLAGRKEATPLPEQLYAYAREVAGRHSTPDNPLRIQFGGHSKGAMEAPVALASFLKLNERDGNPLSIPALTMLAPVMVGDAAFANALEARVNTNGQQRIISISERDDLVAGTANGLLARVGNYADIGTQVEVDHISDNRYPTVAAHKVPALTASVTALVVQCGATLRCSVAHDNDPEVKPVIGELSPDSGAGTRDKTSTAAAALTG